MRSKIWWSVAGALFFYVLLPWWTVEAGFYLKTLGLSVGAPPHPEVLGVLLGAFGFFLSVAGAFAQWRCGGGTPVPAAPSVRLVRCGPYSLIRNPMLVGESFFLLGVCWAAGTYEGGLLVVAFAFLSALYLLLVEEPSLRKRFGEEYEEYRREVPFLLPFSKRTVGWERGVYSFFLLSALIAFFLSPPFAFRALLELDWEVVGLLFSLFSVSYGLERSGVFRAVSGMMRGLNRRRFSFALISAVFVSSALFTNDSFLLIAVPFTVSVYRRDPVFLGQLVTLEIIAANVGSSLTPFGNPQNAYLFHASGVSPVFFLKIVFLPFAVSTVLLFVFWHVFALKWGEGGREKGNGEEKGGKVEIKWETVGVSILAFVLSLVTMRTLWVWLVGGLLLIYYVFIEKYDVRDIDWDFLVFLTSVLFVFSALQRCVGGFFHLRTSFSQLFLASALASQIFNNVVVAVSFNKLTGAFASLLWGTNVGGNGLITASFANIIGLRLLGNVKGKYRTFTAISLAFFLASLLVLYPFTRLEEVRKMERSEVFCGFPTENNRVLAVDGAKVWEVLKPTRDEVDVDFSIAIAEIEGSTAPHALANWEVYVVLKGKGRFHAGDKTAVLGEGSVWAVPPRTVQWVENLEDEPLKVACIVSPPWSPECELGVVENKG